MICAEGLPNTYAGIFSGSAVTPDWTASWTGDVTFERLKPPDPRGVQCDGRGVACYAITGGSVTWETSTTPGADCTYQSARKTVSIPLGQGMLTVDASGGETPGYSGGFAVFDTALGTQQCDSNPPEPATFYLADCCWVSNAGAPWGDHGENGGLRLLGTRTTGDSTFRVTHNWDFSGR